jgi:protein-disulfide isomerase
MAGDFRLPRSRTFERQYSAFSASRAFRIATAKSFFNRKEHMHRLAVCWSVILVSLTIANAQQKDVPNHSQASKSPASGAQARHEVKLPSEETVNAFLRETFAYNPGLSWKISEIKPSQAEGLAEVTVVLTTPQGLQTNQFYVTADGNHAIAGQIIPFGAHPYAAAQRKLEKEADGFSRGPADAAVTIFEFSDLQCPHCKEAQPIIEKLLSEEKNVRLVFQNYPLASHDWAEKGAEYADCVGRASNSSFWKFLQGVYDAQSDITAGNADDKLKELAGAAGVNDDEIAECAAKPGTLGRVERSVELGNSLGVSGTPTLFINGRNIPNLGSLGYDVLKQLVDFAAKDK